MENEFSQDFSIETLQDSEEGSNIFEERADQVVEDLTKESLRKYFDIIAYTKELKEKRKIKQKQYDETIAKVIAIAREESGESAIILELERDIDLKDQYASQVKILQELGLISQLPNCGQLGILGVDGQEYPIPDLADLPLILSKEKAQNIREKVSQGFNKLLIVPFALDLNSQIERYRKLLVEKSKAKELRRGTGILKQRLKLHPEGSVALGTIYKEEKPSYLIDDLSTFPPTKLEFGKKEEILKVENGYKTRPWRIQLVKDIDKIDEKNNTFPNSLSPWGLVETMQEISEEPFSVDDWIMLAMSKLQGDGVLIDQHVEESGDNGCVCLNTYFPKQETVGYCEFQIYKTANGMITTIELNGHQRSHYWPYIARTSVPLN